MEGASDPGACRPPGPESLGREFEPSAQSIRNRGKPAYLVGSSAASSGRNTIMGRITARYPPHTVGTPKAVVQARQVELAVRFRLGAGA